MEIEQKAKRFFEELHVAHELCLVDRENFLDGLKLKNQSVINTGTLALPTKWERQFNKGYKLRTFRFSNLCGLCGFAVKFFRLLFGFLPALLVDLPLPWQTKFGHDRKMIR